MNMKHGFRSGRNWDLRESFHWFLHKKSLFPENSPLPTSKTFAGNPGKSINS